MEVEQLRVINVYSIAIPNKIILIIFVFRLHGGNVDNMWFIRV